MQKPGVDAIGVFQQSKECSFPQKVSEDKFAFVFVKSF
jgi:hypothetical protein